MKGGKRAALSQIQTQTEARTSGCGTDVHNFKSTPKSRTSTAKKDDAVVSIAGDENFGVTGAKEKLAVILASSGKAVSLVSVGTQTSPSDSMLTSEEETVEYLKAVRTQQSQQIQEILEENRALSEERNRMKEEIEILEGMLEDAKLIANSILELGENETEEIEEVAE